MPNDASAIQRRLLAIESLELPYRMQEIRACLSLGLRDLSIQSVGEELVLGKIHQHGNGIGTGSDQEPMTAHIQQDDLVATGEAAVCQYSNVGI